MDALALELRRVLPAPPAAVFAAFTEPEQLARFWGPEGFTVPEVRFEAVAGEPYRIAMRPPEGERFHLEGEVLEVEPPARLAFTFRWDPPDPEDVETTVRLAFRALGPSTEVGLAQGPFATEARLALHRDGWSETLGRLERLLAG
jgi:uncharacterized protein YndB with AHSA1/START domain